MKKIILSVIPGNGLTTASKAQFRPGAKVSSGPADRSGVKPVENDEVFDHLFLDKFRSLAILRKTAA